MYIPEELVGSALDGRQVRKIYLEKERLFPGLFSQFFDRILRSLSAA